MMQRIAVIPGDGIGKEMMPEGLRALDAAARRHGLEFRYEHHDFASCDYYLKHGAMMPDDWKGRLDGVDAIFYGAVGGRPPCRTTSRCGAPCSSSAASSTSTSTCGRAG